MSSETISPWDESVETEDVAVRKALGEMAAEIQRREVAEAKRKFSGDLTPAQEDIIEQMAVEIVDGVIGPVESGIRRTQDLGGDAAVVADLFDIDVGKVTERADD